MLRWIRNWWHDQEHPWGHKIFYACHGEGCERCTEQIDPKHELIVSRRRHEELMRKVPRRYSDG